jgi:ATP-dependent helicase HepA
LAGMLEAATDDVEARADRLLLHHARAGVDELKEEILRLRHLKTVNPAVRQDEIDHLAALIDAAEQAVRQPRVRIDAVRVLVGL